MREGLGELPKARHVARGDVVQIGPAHTQPVRVASTFPTGSLQPVESGGYIMCPRPLRMAPRVPVGKAERRGEHMPTSIADGAARTWHSPRR